MLTYFCCPTHVVTMLRGKPYPFLVLVNLILHRNTTTNNTHFVSIPKLTNIVGISQREVYNSIDVLKGLGLIEELANRKGERMFHLPFLAEENFKTENTETDAPVTVEYKVDPKLQAAWDKEFGVNGGAKNG